MPMDFYNVNLPNKMGGGSIAIPLTASTLDNPNGVTTPEWMVQMDSLLSSTVDGYTQYSQLFGWIGQETRFTQGETVNQLRSTSAVSHSNVFTLLPKGPYLPPLQTKRESGDNIQNIRIVRLANIKNMRVVLEENLFLNSKVELVEQALDKFVLAFRPTSGKTTIYQYEQDGKLKGQTAYAWDATSGKAQDVS